MSRRKKKRRKPDPKQRERQRQAYQKRKLEAAAEYYSELWELTELIRWIKWGYDNPGTAIQNYAKKHGWDLTKKEWTL